MFLIIVRGGSLVCFSAYCNPCVDEEDPVLIVSSLQLGEVVSLYFGLRVLGS